MQQAPKSEGLYHVHKKHVMESINVKRKEMWYMLDNMLRLKLYILCLISLVWFNGISTIKGYLMPSHFYTYISNI